MSDNPLDELNKEEQKALVELAKARAEGSISRRDMMKVGSLIGSGALIGGGASQSIGTAAAAASDSDSDGDIGSPGNRIDVFADGVDASSVESDAVTANTTLTDPAAVDHTGELSDNPHDNSDHSTDMIEDATTTGNAPYEVQKDGTDGTGVINFKTV